MVYLAHGDDVLVHYGGWLHIAKARSPFTTACGLPIISFAYPGKPVTCLECLAAEGPTYE